jgi:cytochrome c553
MRKQYYISLLLLIGFHFILPAQEEWVVPQDRKGKLSPFEFSEASKASGLSKYNTNCASCHGQPGAGNFQKLVPPPGDPASSGFQENLDGEMFYKVMEGRGQMPSFKAVLAQDEIWEIVSYLRSFNNEYVHVFMPSSEKSAFGGVISITISHLLQQGKIEAKVTGIKNGIVEPIAGADVVMRVKRYYGNLVIGEPITTNENGIALFDEPATIPGDTIGNLSLSLQLADQEMYGVSKIDTMLAVGKQNITVSLTQERAMWNTVKKAPIWLLLTYTLAVLAAWATIFYILHQLKNISVIGKNHEPTNHDH